MLKLKSQVKDMFKAAGLEDFTIGRDTNGNLAIVGPCGRDIVQVTNFSVGSKLTNEERSIAIDEYIEPTLVKHAHVILDMIKYREAEIKAEDAVADALENEKTTHKTSCKASKSGYGENVYEFTSSITHTEKDDDNEEILIVTVKREDDGTIMSFVKTVGTEATVRASKLAKTIEKRLVVITNLYIDYVVARKAFQAAEKSMVKECAL